MTNPPFGFSSRDPDEGDDDRPGGSGGGPSGPFGPLGGLGGLGGPGGTGGPGGGFDMSQLGQMLTQLGQALSQASTGQDAAGPVNYDLAKQVALQNLSTRGLPSAAQADAAAEAVRLAELWLDPVTALPAGATSTATWAPRDWVEHTLPTWQRMCDPVARQMSSSWVEALPDEARQAAGPLMSMLEQMGGLAFGSQLGSGLAQLAGEVLTSTDVGLPLGPEGVAALMPAAIEDFAAGLGLELGEVRVFLAAREAAHHRLFAHVPWLRERLLGAVEEFAQGIRIDTGALEDLAGRIDPSDPQSMQQLLQSGSGLLTPQTTPEQQAALSRLETLLALIEGWIDVVVTDAAGDRLPGAEALRETLRRRRASGGPAEQTFANLVGLELRPRKLRAAAQIWRDLTDTRGIADRDAVWEHPDLVPTAEDLDDPESFGRRFADLEDPIAALERTADQAPTESDPQQAPQTDDTNRDPDRDPPEDPPPSG